MFRFLRNLFFPVECAGCGAALKHDDKFGICERCVSSIESVDLQGCIYCGKPVNFFGGCENCRDRSSKVDLIYTHCYYNDIMKKLIRNFKYNGKVFLAEYFGEKLYLLFREKLAREQVDFIVPVPAHKSRVKERGFNQAEKLAGYISSKSGIKLLSGGLVRIRDTAPQYGLGRLERFKNVSGAFEPRYDFTSRTVLLVDDLATTGATLQNCASALKKAGAENVYALILAHGK